MRPPKRQRAAPTKATDTENSANIDTLLAHVDPLVEHETITSTIPDDAFIGYSGHAHTLQQKSKKKKVADSDTNWNWRKRNDFSYTGIEGIYYAPLDEKPEPLPDLTNSVEHGRVIIDRTATELESEEPSPRSSQSYPLSQPAPKRSKRNSQTPPKFSVNMRIEARFKGRTRFWPGVITAINNDGSYDILYDDGDKEKRVKERFVRLDSEAEFGITVDELRVKMEEEHRLALRAAPLKPLGLTFLPQTPPHLLHLLSISPSSPAASTTLLPGDVILSINGFDVRSWEGDDIEQRVLQCIKGVREVAVEYVRCPELIFTASQFSSKSTPSDVKQTIASNHDHLTTTILWTPLTSHIETSFSSWLLTRKNRWKKDRSERKDNLLANLKRNRRHRRSYRQKKIVNPLYNVDYFTSDSSIGSSDEDEVPYFNGRQELGEEEWKEWIEERKWIWARKYSWRADRQSEFSSTNEAVTLPSVVMNKFAEREALKKWLSVRKKEWSDGRERKRNMIPRPNPKDRISVNCPAIPRPPNKPFPAGWYDATVVSVQSVNDSGSFEVSLIWDGGFKKKKKISKVVDPEWKLLVRPRPDPQQYISIRCPEIPPYPAGWYDATVLSVRSVSGNESSFEVALVWDGSSGDVEKVTNPEWRPAITLPKVDQMISIKCPAIPPHEEGWYAACVVGIQMITKKSYEIAVIWDGSEGEVEFLTDPEWMLLTVEGEEVAVEAAEGAGEGRGEILVDVVPGVDDLYRATSNSNEASNVGKANTQIAEILPTTAAAAEVTSVMNSRKSVMMNRTIIPSSFDLNFLFDARYGCPDDCIVAILHFIDSRYHYFLLMLSTEISAKFSERERVWEALSRLQRPKWIFPYRMRKSWCSFYLSKLKEYQDRKMRKSNELLVAAYECLFRGDNCSQVKSLVKNGEEDFGFDINYLSGSVMERNGLLNLAVIEKCLNTVKWLILKKNAFIESKDRGFFTPLLNAAYNGDLPMVRFLMKQGADRKAMGLNHSSRPMLYKNTGVYEGYDAEGWARKMGHEQCAKVIRMGLSG